MKDINIGFIGLGNLGKNLANSILLGGYKLFIHDLNKKTSIKLLKKGAIWCEDVETIMKNNGKLLKILFYYQTLKGFIFAWVN